MSTMIRINDETKSQLINLKIHPRETYEDVIKRLIAISYQESINKNKKGKRDG